ncbi:MAG TPA: M56 family metallopeptidase, partial [Allosphingosinicella sp.]|nr:M56 family metallopeptidase [Allosphingosinicella sp.]
MSAEFFVEMAWKSALISGAALALATALRSRAAADRAMVLRVGVAGLLLLPAIALWLPALQVEAWSAPQGAAPAAAALAESIPEAGFAVPVAVDLQPEGTTIWDDPTPLVLLAYLGGLLMAAGRLLAGIATLGRWTASARTVACPEWLAAFERARWAAPNGERLRLLVSDSVPSPLSWGWLRPVILIDPDTLAQPDDADAILAHEIAHVARRDWPVLILSRLAAALFWFNPLVWMLEREVVQQAEEAADCHAVDRVEPSRYAQTLLSWAWANGAVPANSIAPSEGALARRIRAVLDGRVRNRPGGSAWTAIAILACIAIAAPVAAVELVEARPAPAPVAPPA